MRQRVVAVAALIAIVFGLWHLLGATSGVTITHERVGSIPATVLRPVADGPAPLVVVAHGFAGSQQLMQPFATTLARNGYLVVTFDFPGHGRHPTPLAGGLADEEARNRALDGALDDVVRFARRLPGGDGRLALLGHSMASDIVVRHAMAHPEVQATVAVSLFAPGVTASSPRNLLVIDGALEPAMLKDEGLRIAGLAAGGRAQEGVTYGSFADGTARRLALAGGVEHIGVLYSAESMAEALAWMNQALGRQGGGFLDARGPWLGLLFAGLVALAWPLAGLLPEVAGTPRDSGLGWRRLLPVALFPALATPLALWKLPTDFLPILLGDYLAVHFALYGLLTAVGIWIVARPGPLTATAPTVSWKLAMAIVAVVAYGTVAVFLPIDRFVTSFMPIPERLPLIAAMMVGTLPYFIADEWLTRGASAPRGAYAVTKLCFLVSLVLAVALSLERLFFLIIIVPAILIFFMAFGLLSGWAYGRTRHPLVGAVANALIFAWAIAVTFPTVSR